LTQEEKQNLIDEMYAMKTRGDTAVLNMATVEFDGSYTTISINGVARQYEFRADAAISMLAREHKPPKYGWIRPGYV
jgi:hypothetical protein